MVWNLDLVVTLKMCGVSHFLGLNYLFCQLRELDKMTRKSFQARIVPASCQAQCGGASPPLSPAPSIFSFQVSFISASKYGDISST
jgi:hypothetical protein